MKSPLLSTAFAFATLLGFGLIGNAHATSTPLTALSCVDPATKNFVTLGISMDTFDNSAEQKILGYTATVGSLDSNGRQVSSKAYGNESNMKTFNDAKDALDWLNSNTLVIPLTEGKETHGALLLELGKKKVTFVDTDYETIETFTGCIVD